MSGTATIQYLPFLRGYVLHLFGGFRYNVYCLCPGMITFSSLAATDGLLRDTAAVSAYKDSKPERGPSMALHKPFFAARDNIGDGIEQGRGNRSFLSRAHQLFLFWLSCSIRFTGYEFKQCSMHTFKCLACQRIVAESGLAFDPLLPLCKTDWRSGPKKRIVSLVQHVGQVFPRWLQLIILR